MGALGLGQPARGGAGQPCHEDVGLVSCGASHQLGFGTRGRGQGRASAPVQKTAEVAEARGLVGGGAGVGPVGGGVAKGTGIVDETEYLERHGTAGHLDYARFRRRGVPLGSGAIESAIRRVINLRLKGNSISWYKANAEGMLLLRCLVLSNRWDDTFAQISTSMASNRRLDWSFRSPDMPAQLKAKITIEPPKPQVLTAAAPCATAA